jgi:hypothetical protein
MSKRILSKLSQAGYFKRANGVLYAAAKRALRKPLSEYHVKGPDELDQEFQASLGVPHTAADASQQPSPTQGAED